MRLRDASRLLRALDLLGVRGASRRRVEERKRAGPVPEDGDAQRLEELDRRLDVEERLGAGGDHEDC